MFLKRVLRKEKKAANAFPYDPARHTAVIRCSICTGEQTAGFKDNETGVFHEERLIRGEEDLEQFKAQYHLQDIRKEY